MGSAAASQLGHQEEQSSLPWLPWACSGPLGACPAGPQDPQHLLPSHPLLFVPPQPNSALYSPPYGVISSGGGRAKPMSSGGQKPLHGQRGFPVQSHLPLPRPGSCCSWPHGIQENSASPGKLWVTYSLPGLKHQGSPRSLGLVTGRQCDRAASHQLFVDILHASVSTPVLPNLFSKRGKWGQGSSVYPSEHPYQAPPEWPPDSGVVSHHSVQGLHPGRTRGSQLGAPLQCRAPG